MSYDFHEVASLFPLMDSESFESLKKDILENGLIEPIWLYDGKIIDGRNRFNACKETGIEAKFKEWDGKGSLVQFVVSLNVNRRHLTPSQKAVVAMEMLPMLEAEAKERQRVAGKETHGHRHSTDLQLLPDLGEAVKPGSHVPSSVRIAASAIGVSHGNISDMKRIAKVAPERVDAIKQGKATVNGVTKELKQTGVIVPKVKKQKQEEERDMEKNPFSNAHQFSTIAISQLTRIRIEDPQRVSALLEVKEYIENQLKIEEEEQ